MWDHKYRLQHGLQTPDANETNFAYEDFFFEVSDFWENGKIMFNNLFLSGSER